jgi:hypothetical protein
MSDSLQQISNSFDPITKQKILKGAVIALGGGAMAVLLATAWQLGIERTAILGFLTWLVPFSINATKQFLAGAVPPT